MIRSKEDGSLLMGKWLKFPYFGLKNSLNTCTMGTTVASTYWRVEEIKQVDL